MRVKQLSQVAQMVKNLSAMLETRVPSLGWEDPLKKGMATHSSILAWEIPWTDQPGGLLSMGLQESGTTEQLTSSWPKETKFELTSSGAYGCKSVRVRVSEKPEWDRGASSALSPAPRPTGNCFPSWGLCFSANEPAFSVLTTEGPRVAGLLSCKELDPKLEGGHPHDL